jgi:MOSC domain-containing protein YiiM
MIRSMFDHAAGRLEWIGIRPARREPVLAVDRAVLVPGKGIAGDHFRQKRSVNREVTLIQHEDLAEIARRIERETVPPELLRRNLVVSGIEVARLEGIAFRIGRAVLRGTGPCSPCIRMDEVLGPLGRKAMSRRGGITAMILCGGEICVGDGVEPSPAGNDTTRRAD